MSSVALLATTGLLLGLQLRLASRLGRVAQVILGAQCAFWLLSFVLRPLYLMVTHPPQSHVLYDSRLASSLYGSGLGEALMISAVGQAAYTVCLYLLGRTRWARVARGPRMGLSASDRSVLLATCFGFAVIGWMGRASSLAGLSGMASALRPFGVLAACLLLIFTPGRRSGGASRVVVAVVGLETVWAFANSSKGALMIPLFALCVRWALRYDGRKLLARVALVGGLALAVFLILQPLRGINTAAEVASRDTGSLSAVRGAYVSLLERFDGLSAVVDAESLGRGRWLTVDEYAARAIGNIVPDDPTAAQQSATTGLNWTREVRSMTVPNQYQYVSLAAGPAAEGYALAGWAGVLLMNMALAAVTVAASWGLASRRYLVVIASGSVLFTTVIFEQAILGVTSTLTKAIQLVAVALLLLPVIRSMLPPRLLPERGNASPLVPEQTTAANTPSRGKRDD